MFLENVKKDLSAKIRKAEPKDLDSIYKFLCELESEELEYEVFKRIFGENISNPNYVYFVLDNETTTVGFISFHTQNLLHHCGTVGEIQELYVDGNYRDRGFGKLLVNEVKKYAEINKLKSIEVSSNNKRTENVKVYESLGFDLTHNKFTIYKR